MQVDTPAMRALRIILALALLGSLVWAGARIYRKLPATNAASNRSIAGGAEQDLTIVFRTAISASETKVNLYPIDFSAAERDYLAIVRPGKTLEDFLAQRLKNVTPVDVRTDANGRAVT